MSYKFMSDALDNNLMPIGKSDFLNLFKDLEIGEGDILIAHVSLSKFGYIIGGARCNAVLVSKSVPNNKILAF